MTRPGPVAGARAPGAEAAHVETAELPALDELVARRDLVQDARCRMTGAQEIQTEMTEARIGAGLGGDRADSRGHVDAPRGHRHLAGRVRGHEHVGALAEDG